MADEMMTLRGLMELEVGGLTGAAGVEFIPGGVRLRSRE